MATKFEGWENSTGKRIELTGEWSGDFFTVGDKEFVITTLQGNADYALWEEEGDIPYAFGSLFGEKIAPPSVQQVTGKFEPKEEC